MNVWSGALMAALLSTGLLGSASPHAGAGSAAGQPIHSAEALAADPSLRARGRSDGEPSEVAAAVVALSDCAARRAELGIHSPCELVRLDDQQILTGAALRDRVPQRDHPLFLWRLRTERAELYLAGSVHALKATLYPLPEPFEAAFAQSDVLVVEVDTISDSAQQQQRELMTETLLPAGVTLDTVIGPATLARLNAYLATQGIAPASLAGFKPVMIATQLSVTRLIALGYLPEYGLERHFIERAGDRRIVELETLEDQLRLLTDPPMALQEQLLLDTLDQLPELHEITSDLIIAWLSGDAAELRRLFDEQSGQSDAYQAFTERLLGQRNLAMVQRIETLLDTPGTYFVLVGAAHLTGSDGIVTMLEERGYVLDQITSNETL